MSEHRHRPARTETRPFMGNHTKPRRPEPRAHGGVTIVATCRCGATRRTHASAGYSEVERWLTPEGECCA